MLPAGFSVKKLLTAVCSFGAIQAAQMLLPFLAFPFLARVLGLDVFGVLLYALTLSTLLCMGVEWGFLHWGTREIAAHRDDAVRCGRVLRAVTCGKLLLAAVCAALMTLVCPWLPYAEDYPALYAGAAAYGIVWGFNPTWCLQGLGHGLRAAALVETGGGALALGLTFLYVRGPEQALLYPFFLLLTKAAGYGWLTRHLYRALPAGAASENVFAAGVWALRGAWLLFTSRAACVAYTNGVTLVLGWLLTAPHMALLILADKIVRAVVSVSYPVTQALFPEVCALNAQNAKDGTVGAGGVKGVDSTDSGGPDAADSVDIMDAASTDSAAVRLLRLSLLLTGASMLAAALALALCAPWAVRLVLGAENPDAAAVLRAYCPLIPLVGCDFVLSIQTLIPLRQEKALTRIHLLTALLAVPAAALVSWAFSLDGAQYLACGIELLVFLLYCHRIRQVCPVLLAWPFGRRKEF